MNQSDPGVDGNGADTDGSGCAQQELAYYCLEFLQSGKEPRTCLDYICRGRTLDGIYDVYPTGFSDYSLPVYCDQTTDGGGWTVSCRLMTFLLLVIECHCLF